MLFKIKYLESSATPEEIFNIINSYFQRRNIASNGCIEICIDVVSRINKMLHPDLITTLVLDQNS